MNTYNNVNDKNTVVPTTSRKVGYIVAGVVVLALLLLGLWGFNDNGLFDGERDSIVSTVPAELKATDVKTTVTTTDGTTVKTD